MPKIRRAIEFLQAAFGPTDVFQGPVDIHTESHAE
jgi:hypothetical protein